MRPVRHPLRCILAAVLLSGAACASFGGPGWRGPRSDHFDGTRFHNFVRIRDAQIEDAIRREWHVLTGKRGTWARWQDVPTDVPPARVTGDSLRVTVVNHATVLIQTRGVNVLTDPVWSERVSPVGWAGPSRHRPPGIRFEDLPPIDVVLISHDHYDHMDVPTLRRLVARFHPRIVTGLGNAAYLETQGIVRATEIDWWQTVPIAPGVRLTGVPAQHWSARTLFDKWRRLWLGFVLETPAGPIYFAGDTGLGAFFPLLRQRFGAMRLAVLPISPMRPRGAMAARHISAAEAVTVAEALGAATSVPMHYGTFQQGDDAQEEPLDSLRAALRRPNAPRFVVLPNGGSAFVR